MRRKRILPEPYYTDEASGITIYHGNSLDILPALPKCDLILTDPPYEADVHTQSRQVARAGGKLKTEPIPFPPITERERRKSSWWMAHRSRRWILVFCQVEGAMLWRAALERGGAAYRRTMIWVKPDGKPTYGGDRPASGYESIVAMHAPKRSRWNGGGKAGVFTYNKNDPVHGRRNSHPTQKPRDLMRQLVTLFSDPGELIIDPYMGSGTTLIAARDLGRRAIGIELDEKYCEIAVRRLKRPGFAFVPPPKAARRELFADA